MNQEPSIPELILASGSVIRKTLMERLAVPFSVKPADVDETPAEKEHPRELALRLSADKALAVSAQHPGAWVIGSDQVAWHDGAAAGKPGTVERAEAALRAYSGTMVAFHTGVVVAHQGQVHGRHIDLTRVYFRHLSDDEITRYVAADQPLDCAGSFRLESRGPMLFQDCRTDDPTALLGLPMIALCRLLRGAGFSLP